jgi:hypothetical protein
MSTFYPNRDSDETTDDVTDKTLFLVVNCLAFVDSLDEAKVLLGSWSGIPDRPRTHIIDTIPMSERSWDQIFEC